MMYLRSLNINKKTFIIVPLILFFAACGGGSDNSDKSNNTPEAPTLTLIGRVSISINLNEPYIELGANAYDAEDGDLSSQVVVDASAVNTAVAGTYTVIYSVTDSMGSSASPISRTVYVVNPNLGLCTGQTGTVVALDFDYVTSRNASRPTMLAATSEDITFNHHSVDDYPDINWSRRYKNYKVGNGGAAITQWIVAEVPANGILYEAGVALNNNDTFADPDDLMYVPDEEFIGTDRFTYCATDSTGLSNTASVTITVADPANYPMPIGISNPGFGIDEQPPADPAEWPSAESAGFYYINGSAGNCSDINTYGFPDTPRCTLPSGATIDGGFKAVIAGTTPLRNFSWHLVNMTGSAGNAAWLVGNDRAAIRPTLTRNSNRDSTELRITGGYAYISGITLDGVALNHRGASQSTTSTDQMVIRHSTVKNNPSTNGGGNSVGLATGGNGVLALNVYAHDNGIVDPTLDRERDIHAFVGTNQTNFWMLDISCSENAGDCVQLTNNNTTRNVYIGRMASHSEGENCIDIKDNNVVVVSESDCWDLRAVKYGNSGGNAQAFYVNDEGVQQSYVWFLNNRSWDTSGVHYGASNIGGRVYFVGNRAFFGPADGINFGSGGGERHALFNTLVGNSTGIYHFGSGSAVGRYIAGNVIVDATQYQTRLQADTSVINAFNYNFYSASASNGVFATGGSTPNEYIGLSAFNANSGFDTNGQEGVVLGFTDVANYNVSLTNNSDLINAIPASYINELPTLTDLINDLGINLNDFNGTVRPSTNYFDAGADEAWQGSN